MNIKVQVIYPRCVDSHDPRRNVAEERVSFEIDTPSFQEAPDDVYRQMNRVDGSEYISTAKLKMRSMSVGDVMVLDPEGPNEKALLVDKHGFWPLDKETLNRILNAEVAWFDRMNGSVTFQS